MRAYLTLAPCILSAPVGDDRVPYIDDVAHWPKPRRDGATVQDSMEMSTFPFLIVCIGRCLPESLLLHDALQRMLVFAGKVHNLRHFSLSNLIRVNATFADAVLMHMHHDPVRRFVILVEETLEDVDHELHRRVV